MWVSFRVETNSIVRIWLLPSWPYLARHLDRPGRQAMASTMKAKGMVNNGNDTTSCVDRLQHFDDISSYRRRLTILTFRLYQELKDGARGMSDGV